MKNNNKLHQMASSHPTSAAAVPSTNDNRKGTAAVHKQLMTQKEVCEYLGISIDTFREIKEKLNIQTFANKYYSKPYLDFLLIRIPIVKHSRKSQVENIDIDYETDKTLSNLFRG